MGEEYDEESIKKRLRKEFKVTREDLCFLLHCINDYVEYSELQKCVFQRYGNQRGSIVLASIGISSDHDRIKNIRLSFFIKRLKCLKKVISAYLLKYLTIEDMVTEEKLLDIVNTMGYYLNDPFIEWLNNIDLMKRGDSDFLGYIQPCENKIVSWIRIHNKL